MYKIIMNYYKICLKRKFWRRIMEFYEKDLNNEESK